MKKHWALASHLYLQQKDAANAEKLTAEALDKYMQAKISQIAYQIPSKTALKEHSQKLSNRKNCDVNRLMEIYGNFK